MPFTYNSATRTILADTSPVAEFLTPLYRESEADGDGIPVTADSPFSALLTVEQADDARFLCRIAWTNRTDIPRRWQGAVTVRADFAAERYLIP